MTGRAMSTAQLEAVAAGNAAATGRDGLFRAEADLAMWLAERVWDRRPMPLGLAGGDWRIAYGEQVPGHEDSNAVLLRSPADGKVYEAEISVHLREVREVPGDE